MGFNVRSGGRVSYFTVDFTSRDMRRDIFTDKGISEFLQIRAFTDKGLSIFTYKVFLQIRA